MEDSRYVIFRYHLPFIFKRGKIAFYERFAGRPALLEFAAQKSIPVAQTAAKPWSTGDVHNSYYELFIDIV
jgi:hypothetical protein